MSAPWLKFYPSDWRADPALRMCSIAARGLWMEMLCVMHEASPYGSLRVNGNAVSERQMASLAGASLDEVSSLIAELEQAGVLSRDDDGVIYSRRMQRDKAKAESDRANGKRGGNPALQDGVNPQDKAQKPDTRSQSSSLRSDEDAPRKRERASRLPETWALPDGWGIDAIEAGLPATMIDVEAAKMRDWSLSSPDGAKKDWRAAWRNWCRRAAERVPTARGSPPLRMDDFLGAVIEQQEMRNAGPDQKIEGYPPLVRAIPGSGRAG